MSVNGQIDDYMFQDLSFNGKQVLDAGTGNGIFTVKLIQKVAKAKGTRKVVSVDIDETKFDKVSARLKGQQSKYVEFVRADLASLSFMGDNTFDIVFCHHIIHIINSRPLKASQALYEFYRVLKPKGFLIINENYPLNSTHNKEYRNFYDLKKMKYMLSMYFDRTISPRIYPEDLAYILKKIGFAKTELKAFQDQTFHIKLFEHFHDEIKNQIPKIEDKVLKDYFNNKLNEVKQSYHNNPGVIPPQYVINLVK